MHGWMMPGGRRRDAVSSPGWTSAESLRLLATVPVGRLIFTVNALPAVRLMNFVLAQTG